MALVQQARDLERRLAEIEGQLESFPNGQERWIRVEREIADLKNLGDPRPRLDDIDRRLSLAREALAAVQAEQGSLASRLDAEIRRRRMSPLRGLLMCGASVGAYWLCLSRGVASSVSLTLAVGVGFVMFLLVRAGD